MLQPQFWHCSAVSRGRCCFKHRSCAASSLEPMEDKQQLHKLSTPCQVRGHAAIWHCSWFSAWEIDKRLNNGSGTIAHPSLLEAPQEPIKGQWGEEWSTPRWSWWDQSVLPWGKGACLRLSEEAGCRAGSLAACRLPCQPCTTSFQAQHVFQQDVQFHHLLIQASGCHVAYLSVCLFGFLKCACPAPLASNMLLPASCTLQIWVPPWKASTLPAIFGTEASIVLCCSPLGSTQSSPGPTSLSTLSLSHGMTSVYPTASAVHSTARSP